MHLPNAHLGVVEEKKITDYLLNAAHPDNGGKARFFGSLDFKPSEWQLLAQALTDLSREQEVNSRVASTHGEKFVIDGELRSPSGKSGAVRTVWIIDAGTDFPRFVTAYPIR